MIRLSASTASIHEVDVRYLSFTIDLGQIAEPTRFWNPDGSGETVGRPTFDFANERMINMTAALAPAFIRIGGTEADRVIYALSGTPPAEPPSPFNSVLSSKHVDALGRFAIAAGLRVSFTVNAGWGARTVTGVWDSTQTRALMRYVGRHNYPFTVWELGNEPNAWPLFQKNLVVEPEAYAADLAELAAARDNHLPSAKIAGPSTAYWPTIGEVPAFPIEFPPRLITDFLPRVLRAAESHVVPDIVSWHYYPGLSNRSALARYRPELASIVAMLAVMIASLRASRNLLPRRATLCLATAALATAALACAVNGVVRPIRTSGPLSIRDPVLLDTAARWGGAVSKSASQLPGQPAVWLGETGSAQVGGEPGVSGRWISSLWWLDQLGLLATHNHSVQCRQTLSGSDYGLINDSTLQPTPDYWASLLWKRLMGPHVLRAHADGAPHTVRVYAHRSGPATTSHDTTYLVINLGETPVDVELPGGGAEVWLLEGPHLNSRECTINGERAAMSAEGNVPDFPPARIDRPRVPPNSAAFVRAWMLGR